MQNGIEQILVFNPADAAFLKTSIPISILLDATWKQFIEGYGPFRRFPFCEETKDHGALGEQLGFQKAATLICMTSWAAEGVSAEYPMYSGKIKVILPGANLIQAPAKTAILQSVATKLSKQQYSLLFVGADPYRKGLDIAIQVTQQLVDEGLDVVLQVAGFNVDHFEKLPPFVRFFGVLDKTNVDHVQVMHRLFSESDIFLFPTRAECAGIVLCEAAAYGIPAITSGVGGTSDLVIDGQTGFVVGEDASPFQYAKAIKRLLTDRTCYQAMARQARDRFDSNLNWSVFTERMLST